MKITEQKNKTKKLEMPSAIFNVFRDLLFNPMIKSNSQDYQELTCLWRSTQRLEETGYQLDHVIASLQCYQIKNVGEKLKRMHFCGGISMVPYSEMGMKGKGTNKKDEIYKYTYT